MTRCVPHEALKLMARGKLTLDERVVFQRVDGEMPFRAGFAFGRQNENEPIFYGSGFRVQAPPTPLDPTRFSFGRACWHHIKPSTVKHCLRRSVVQAPSAAGKAKMASFF